MVNLENVSIYSEDQLKNIVSDDKKYQKTPFLYLISSYTRNKSLAWANDNLKFLEKKYIGSWAIYSFQK